MGCVMWARLPLSFHPSRNKIQDLLAEYSADAHAGATGIVAPATIAPAAGTGPAMEVLLVLGGAIGLFGGSVALDRKQKDASSVGYRGLSGARARASQVEEPPTAQNGYAALHDDDSSAGTAQSTHGRPAAMSAAPDRCLRCML